MRSGRHKEGTDILDTKRIPPLFAAIIDNDAKRAELKLLDVIPYWEIRSLMREHRVFMEAAANAFRSNQKKEAPS